MRLRIVGFRKASASSRPTPRAAMTRPRISGSSWRSAMAWARRSSCRRGVQRLPLSERSTSRKLRLRHSRSMRMTRGFEATWPSFSICAIAVRMDVSSVSWVMRMKVAVARLVSWP